MSQSVLDALQEAIVHTLLRVRHHNGQAGLYRHLECGEVAKQKGGWVGDSLLRYDALAQRMMDLGSPPDFGAMLEPAAPPDTLRDGHEQDLRQARALIERLLHAEQVCAEEEDEVSAALLRKHAEEEGRRGTWLERELALLEELGDGDYVERRRGEPVRPTPSESDA